MGMGCPFKCAGPRPNTPLVLSASREMNHSASRPSVDQTNDLNGKMQTSVSVQEKKQDLEEERLDIRMLSLAVRSLFLPSNAMLMTAVENMTEARSLEPKLVCSPSSFVVVDQESSVSRSSPKEDLNDRFTEKYFEEAAKALRLPPSSFFEELGCFHASRCLGGGFLKALRFLGGTLEDLLLSVENLSTVLRDLDPAFGSHFLNVKSDNGSVQLSYTARTDYLGSILSGTLKKISSAVFGTDLSISLLSRGETYTYSLRTHRENKRSNVLVVLDRAQNYARRLSKDPRDLKVPVQVFCQACPFHFICNKQLHFVQLGKGLLRFFCRRLKSEGNHLASYFRVEEPRIAKLNFQEIVARANIPYILTMKTSGCPEEEKIEGLELKGQMIPCPESGTLLFLGSPVIDGLNGMTERGLYISDIPIHDATRDIILIEEQTRAQDGLKRRMDKLKNTIEEANQAVEKERQTNVDLLNLIFPPHVARKLWLGEQVGAEQCDDVTILFSDIVGFTSICSTATPMMVINMLNELYTQFDAFCGELDVYKIETIGDAYCVAGGLHRRSETHAQQTTWMALKMINAAQMVKAHDGQALQMRIGVHTGPVLAGVVGVSMPRFCLFGNNVTLANKLESGSEPLRVNISPTTHERLVSTPEFLVEARPRTCLPAGFSESEPGTCYFVNGYRYPSLNPSAGLDAHISRAVEHFLPDLILTQTTQAH